MSKEKAMMDNECETGCECKVLHGIVTWCD